MPVDEEVRFQVRVLGPISVQGPAGPVDPGGSKPRLLLSVLVSARGSVVSTERLIDGLWGEDPPATARKTLQVHLSNLRRSLGANFPLETTRTGYRIDPERLSIDAVQFEAELVRGTALRDSAPAEAGDVLAAALQLWTGPPYADVADFEAIRPEVVRLAELRLRAVEQRIDADLRVGRHHSLLGELEALTIDHPYREHLRELQMVALYRCGRQADALRAYERTRRTLADELGLDPGPALRHLYQQILDQSDELDLALDPSDSPTMPVNRASTGRSVRGYELRERLGEGGDGTVFRAYQASLGREVALRVIPPEEANQPAFVKQFEESCQLLAELAHPHIVGLYDYWRDPSGAYVAMPLLRGGSLEQSLERSLWHPPAALQLLDQIGSALGYAHRRGIAHRDVRASNVLLDDDGNAYLSDFVIGGGFGPDQRAAHPLGPADDVSGLALITCEMLTGTGPQGAAFTRVELPSGFDQLIRRATDPNPAHRFERVNDYLRALRRCFGADVVTTASMPDALETRNPFKGLGAFRETDAMDFFGRDVLLGELVTQVSHNGLTAVVGPSGSGKSSLVKAGLVPALRLRGLGEDRDLVIAEMFPGAYPFEELESALMRVAVNRPAHLLAELTGDERGLLRVARQILPDGNTDLLLIIDQFEELFALTAEESVRQAFLASLATVASDEEHRVRVVVTLRADFFDRPLTYPVFGELLRTSMTTVTLPDEASLAEAIAEPARRAGLEIEPGLIPTILRDVADQPGALPMMQYALTELADRSEGNRLTIDVYRRTGGVVAALATRAEQIFSSLSASGREAAREIFVRLVSVRNESDDTRRRVRRTELEGLGIDLHTLESVIDAFGAFRLLSFDHDPITRGPTVEVAHEALIREWPRYRQWIDERRDDLRAEQRLDSAVTEWALSEHDPSFLISGVRLERYEHWAGSSPVRLTAAEREFIETSHAHEQRRLQTSTRRRRHLLAGVSTLAVVALGAAAVAIVQRNRADDAAHAAALQTRTAIEAKTAADELRAETERSAALSGAQAAMARASAQQDPELRLLLALAEHDALEAAGLSDPSVTSALYQAVYDHRVVARLPVEVDATPVEGTRPIVDISASPDGSMLVMGLVHGSRVSTVDARSGDVITTVHPSMNTVGSNWQDDGLVMTGLYDGTVEFWKPTGERTGSMAVSSLPVLPLMLRDGQLVFEEFSTRSLVRFILVVQELDTGQVIFRSPQAQEAIVSRSGNYLAALDDVSGMRVYDTNTWTDVTPEQAAVRASTVIHAAWTAKGDQLWVLTDDRIARIDVATGEEVATIDANLAGLDFVSESLDGQLVAIGGLASYRTPIDVFDTSSGSMVAELSADLDAVGVANEKRSVVWGADHHFAVAQDRRTVIWNLAEPEAGGGFWPRTEVVPVLTSITPSGDRIFGSAKGDVAVFDSSGHLRSSVAAAGEPTAPVVVSLDGATLAVPDGNTIKIVDVASGEVRALGPAGLTRPLALSNDGRLAVVGTALVPNDQQHRVAIIDATTGRQLFNLGGLIDGERAAFTADGKKAIIPVSNFARTADSTRTARERTRSHIEVVDTATGATLGSGRSQECVSAVAISHDDTTVASLGCDGDIVLLDLAALTSDQPYSAVMGGTSDDVTPAVGVTFGPDDEIVIVSRQDGRVEGFRADAAFGRLWSFDVGDHAGAPEVHDGMVWVGTTHDIGAGRREGGMVAMPLDVDALVTLARATETRPLTAGECQQFLALPTC